MVHIFFTINIVSQANENHRRAEDNQHMNESTWSYCTCLYINTEIW